MTNPAVKVVLIRAAGEHFCAGADLKENAKVPSDAAWREYLAQFRSCYELIDQLPVPVVAAVQGFCVAGGLELILSCDFAVAASTARLGDLHVRRNLLPGGGATWLLPGAVGLRNAAFLMMTGCLVTAEQALHMGLVQMVVPPETLTEECRALTAYIASREDAVLQRAKRLTRDAGQRDRAAGYDAEADASVAHFTSGIPTASSRDFATTRDRLPQGGNLVPWRVSP